MFEFFFSHSAATSKRETEKRKKEAYRVSSVEIAGPRVRPLSASYNSCNNGVSSNIYSRIVATLGEVGVPFLSLASGLVAGQTLFVN